jgi:uncharacterized protein YgiM (DUF1202 family)
MPFRKITIGFVVIMAIGTAALGQSPPYETTITVREVEVRSGPSANYYATSKLSQGDRVRVVEEKEGGWLAIEPPPGSFSWIESRVLGKQTAQSAVVMAPEVPVRAGSSLSDRPPDVVSAKLPAGSQVVIMGNFKFAEDGGKWWPIKPQKELRYIPKNAVKPAAPVESSATDASKASNAVLPPSTATATQLWQQAEQARQSGNVAEAQRLYEQCLRQPDIDFQLQVACTNRLQGLKQANGVSVHPGYQSGQPAEATAVAPGYRPPSPPALPPTATSTSNPAQQSQAVGYGPRPGAGQSNATPPGRLRRAGFFIDGKQAYALEDSQGQLLFYVTAQPGVNLEQFINRNVTMTGSMVYHGQLKKDYMVAGQVSQLP